MLDYSDLEYISIDKDNWFKIKLLKWGDHEEIIRRDIVLGADYG